MGIFVTQTTGSFKIKPNEENIISSIYYEFSLLHFLFCFSTIFFFVLFYFFQIRRAHVFYIYISRQTGRTRSRQKNMIKQSR